MVITRKIVNDIFTIDIPDEGVNKAINEIKLDFDNLDSLLNIKYYILSSMRLYHINLINDIQNFIKNNQINFEYDFLDINQYTREDNEVTSFIVKGKQENIIKLGKAISRLINNKKINYNKKGGCK